MFELIKNFIYTNKVKSRSELRNINAKLYKEFIKLSKEEKDILLVDSNNKYQNLNNLDSFSSFIKENKIYSRSDFKKRFSKAYARFRKLSEIDKDLLLPSEIDNKVFSITEIKNIVKNNNVNSRRDLSIRFPKYYKSFEKLDEDTKNFILPKRKMESREDLRSFENFRDFIKKNNINSRKELSDKYGTYYLKLFNKFPIDQQDMILPPKFNTRNKESIPKTFDEFKSYLNNNPHIKCRVDLIKDDIRSYRNFKSLSNEEKDLLLPYKLTYITEFNSLEDFQSYIDENEINSFSDLKHKNEKIYNKLYNTVSKDKRDSLIFYHNDEKFNFGRNQSFGEKYLSELFEGNSIKFILEKTFPDLKNKNNLRFDFYLPEYNTVVEYHGIQHFDKNNNFYSNELIYNDKLKYQYCIDNDIKIIYFTLEKSNQILDYFTEVITDSNRLLDLILN